MMLAAAVAAAQEPGDDVGPDRADVPDEVADDLVVPPLLDRLFDAEREAEIDRAREVLLGAVEAMDRQQLLGAQHAERLERLRPDLVLAAVAARRRDEHRAHALPVAQHRQQRVVLVVGVRVGLHERAGRGELAEHQLQRVGVGPLANRRDAKLRGRSDADEAARAGMTNRMSAHDGTR